MHVSKIDGGREAGLIRVSKVTFLHGQTWAVNLRNHPGMCPEIGQMATSQHPSFRRNPSKPCRPPVCDGRLGRKRPRSLVSLRSTSTSGRPLVAFWGAARSWCFVSESNRAQNSQPIRAFAHLAASLRSVSVLGMDIHHWRIQR